MAKKSSRSNAQSSGSGEAFELSPEDPNDVNEDALSEKVVQVEEAPKTIVPASKLSPRTMAEMKRGADRILGRR